MQIKTTMGYHYTIIQMAVTTEPYNRKCKQGYRTTTHTLLVTTSNGAAITGNNLAASYKVKHTFTTQSSNSTPKYLLK